MQFLESMHPEVIPFFLVHQTEEGEEVFTLALQSGQKKILHKLLHMAHEHKVVLLPEKNTNDYMEPLNKKRKRNIIKSTETDSSPEFWQDGSEDPFSKKLNTIIQNTQKIITLLQNR